MRVSDDVMNFLVFFSFRIELMRVWIWVESLCYGEGCSLVLYGGALPTQLSRYLERALQGVFCLLWREICLVTEELRR